MTAIPLLLLATLHASFELQRCPGPELRCHSYAFSTDSLDTFKSIGVEVALASGLFARLSQEEVWQSTFSERFVGGVLGGVAGVALSSATGLPFRATYTVGSIGGILMATGSREGGRPSAVVVGSALGLAASSLLSANWGEGSGFFGAVIVTAIAVSGGGAYAHGRLKEP
jgi:hypothetical protein